MSSINLFNIQLLETTPDQMGNKTKVTQGIEPLIFVVTAPEMPQTKKNKNSSSANGFGTNMRGVGIVCSPSRLQLTHCDGDSRLEKWD